MTQFLLVASVQPYSEFSDLIFTPVQEDSFLAEVASTLFPTPSKPIWSIAPSGAEIGEVAYEAREAVLTGTEIGNTTLGRFLQQAMSRHDALALFYASDFAQLPRATTPKELLELIDEQLRVEDGSNLELYALWPADG